MKRGHICAVADGQLAGRNHPGEAPAPVVDQEGVLQFEDELPKKVRDIIKVTRKLYSDMPFCLNLVV